MYAFTIGALTLVDVCSGAFDINRKIYFSNLKLFEFSNPTPFHGFNEGILTFRSKPLLFNDFTSTVIFLVGNCKVALPKPVIDCIIFFLKVFKIRKREGSALLVLAPL
jgi:hypothetical protein